MDKLIEIKSKILTLTKNNYLVIAIACVIFLLFLPIIIFSNLSSVQKEEEVTPLPTQVVPNYTPPTASSPTDIPVETGEINEEKTAQDSGPITFVEYSEMAIEGEKETLDDGSIKYTVASLNPNRSDITIVKNGAIVLMRHAVVGQEISDGYKNLLGKQDIILPGPTFYGPNTAIFFYTTGGTALIVDPKTNTTYEEFAFQPPITVDEFTSKYKIYTQ